MTGGGKKGASTRRHSSSRTAPGVGSTALSRALTSREAHHTPVTLASASPLVAPPHSHRTPRRTLRRASCTHSPAAGTPRSFSLTACYQAVPRALRTSFAPLRSLNSPYTRNPAHRARGDGTWKGSSPASPIAWKAVRRKPHILRTAARASPAARAKEALPLPLLSSFCTHHCTLLLRLLLATAAPRLCTHARAYACCLISQQHLLSRTRHSLLPERARDRA